tara:strand:+ start:389 stop:565 length:177 start_codon:yes stop_codon:yes gene_type:complete
MIVDGFVSCNFCGSYIGQIFGSPVIAPGLIEDQTTQPHFCVCPDCYEDSEPLVIERAA